MRKIVSILIALGLVLGLSVMATPTAGWECPGPEGPVAVVAVDPECACEEAAYNITFNTTASLTEGLHTVCVQFPAGTTVPAEFDEGTVLIGLTNSTAVAVFPEEITVTGTKVCFLVPTNFPAGEMMVQFTIDAGIENPCTPDDYVLTVWTSRAPDSTPLEGEYTILPAIASYAFRFDFSDTYPGIRPGFVPPFKACGQNDTTPEAMEAGFNTTYGNDEGLGLDPYWYSQFDLQLLVAVPGCDSPCGNGTVWFELTSIPAGEEIHLWIGSVNYTLDACNITKTVGKYDASTDWKIDPALPLPATGPVASWQSYLHFSSPGTYTFGFYLECPKGPCGEPSAIVASKVQDFKAYQDKDAAKIVLEEKWNLISLPLEPFDTSISSLLAPLPSKLFDTKLTNDELISIHYFDQCTDIWKVYGAGQTSLTTMEAGKSYWVRMNYPAGNYTWWVWGTAKPVPPAAPAAYTMCPGWNMFGFTSLLDEKSDDYLWNFGPAAANPYPLIYRWDNTGTWSTSTWEMVNPATSDWMYVGEGFWGYFPAGGTIVP